jgi:hypothetical protein
MSEIVVHALCKDDCLHETMTKEEILAAIMEATGIMPSGGNSAFISKIKEMNAAGTLQFWVGTYAEYNAIETKKADTLYLITDENDFDEVVKAVSALTDRIIAVEKLTDKLAKHPEPGKVLCQSDISTTLSTASTNISAPGVKGYRILCVSLDDVSNGILVKQYEDSFGYAYFRGNVARFMYNDSFDNGFKVYHDTMEFTVTENTITSITASAETGIDKIIGIC